MIIGLLEEYEKFKYLIILDIWISISNIFRSFLHNYQEELKIIKGSGFIFESVELMDYKLPRVR